MGCSEKVDGIRYSTPINNENHIIEQITNLLNINDYEVNDSYSKLTFESFNKSGFNFKKNIMVDYRYKENLKEDILKSDIVFLCGGHTL